MGHKGTASRDHLHYVARRLPPDARRNTSERLRYAVLALVGRRARRPTRAREGQPASNSVIVVISDCWVAMILLARAIASALSPERSSISDISMAP